MSSVPISNSDQLGFMLPAAQTPHPGVEQKGNKIKS